eukprot:GHUV01024067.1.p1 GENE.GHUV01024067.1~~GHUV01024067.1.p1  ORF type:complete len:329 (+),score=70.35 GHUV01024067.1:891-1877(+)
MWHGRELLHRVSRTLQSPTHSKPDSIGGPTAQYSVVAHPAAARSLCCSGVQYSVWAVAPCPLRALTISCTPLQQHMLSPHCNPLQASSFKSGEVVATLKQALLPDGTTTTLSFSSDDQVLDYIGTRIIKPIWKDPVCGDSKCEVPWEFPAWGPFGCQADCGLNPNTTRVIVRVSADFTGHPSISPKTLMGQVTWNLCLNDTLRTKRGLPALCWFQDDQVFTDEIETQIKAVNLIDGDWYIRLEGDFAGRVTGAVYDGTQDDLVEVPVSPAWEGCKFKRRRIATASTTGRRRLQGVANGNAGPGQQTPRAAAPDTGRPQQSSSASHHDL